jgi:hypothetical protein
LYICIRTAPIGKVWAVTPSDRTTIQLVNSSVAHFATFLLTYEQRIARAAPSSAEEALQIIESTAALLASIDPDAMVPDDGNIWSVEFETLKDIC